MTKEDLLAKYRANNYSTDFNLQVTGNPVAERMRITPPQEEAPTENNKRGFVDRAKDFVGGAVYGFSGAGRTIQNVIAGGVNNLVGKEVLGGSSKEGFENASGTDIDTTSGKIGQFTGETGTFVGPGMLSSAATKGAPLLVKSLAQGGASFAQEALNSGEVGKSAFTAGVVDAAFPIAGKVFDVGSTILKGLAGGLSGTGADVIEAAFQRPGAAFKAAGGDTFEGLKQLSTTIRSGVSKLYEKAGKEYAEKVSEAGVSEIPRDFVVNGIKQRFADLADVVVDGDTFRFVDTPFTDIEERQFTKMMNNVDNWSDFTPEGINNLARKLGRFRRGSPDSFNFDRVVDNLRRDIRSFVGEIAPSIKEANEKYASKMDLLDEIDNVLKTDTAFTGREGIRKTAEALGRIFNGGKDFTREAIEDLESELGIDIIGTLAGQQLTDVAPRSTSRIGGVLDTAIQSVANPVIRNVVPIAGGIKQKVIDRVASIPGIPESIRATIVNTLTNLFREEKQ